MVIKRHWIISHLVWNHSIWTIMMIIVLCLYTYVDIIGEVMVLHLSDTSVMLFQFTSEHPNCFASYD